MVEGRVYRRLSEARVYADVNDRSLDTVKLWDDYELRLGEIGRYELLVSIGSGKYSHVFLGKCDGTQICAIKMLKNIANVKIKREIAVLERLRGVPNVIQLMDVVQDPDSGVISIVTEYEQQGDAKVLFQSVMLNEIRYLMWSLLYTLDRCHAKGVMHRDVKPGNLIMAQDRKSFKVIDWGLSELYVAGKAYTCRVSTMRYKAPELLLNYEYYDYAVDVWSAGVVLGELLLKIPFFDAQTIDDMVAAVVMLCGIEPMVNYVEKYGLSVPEMAITKFPNHATSSWNRIFGLVRSSKKDEHAFDLLKKLLTIDHEERITAKEALAHSFFDPIREEMEQKYIIYT